MIRIYSFFIVLALFVSSEVVALSCARPVLNNDTIASLGFVFEGTVEEEVTPRLWESLKGVKTVTYRFKIDKVWKGKHESDMVTIVSRLSWVGGKPYKVGESYMVFARMAVGNIYQTSPGWCGLDILPKEDVIKAIKAYNS